MNASTQYALHTTSKDNPYIGYYIFERSASVSKNGITA